MRADPNLYAGMRAAMEHSETLLQSALNQLTSGKRVNAPSDDPVAFAIATEDTDKSTAIDQYAKNSDAVASTAQLADAALSSVVTSLTQAISLGTEGGSPGTTAAQRNQLAEQVQGVLQSVVAQANTSASGRALFAGTAATSTPFSIDAADPTKVNYTGNQGVDQVAIGDNDLLSTNVPGDTIFSNASGDVFGSLQQLIGALQSGSATDLAAATSSITSAISNVSQVRAVYSSIVNQTTAQNSFLSQETVTLSSQQSALTDVDTATAATALTQAQTAHSAVLAAAAKILPESLLNYLRS